MASFEIATGNEIQSIEDSSKTSDNERGIFLNQVSRTIPIIVPTKVDLFQQREPSVKSFCSVGRRLEPDQVDSEH